MKHVFKKYSAFTLIELLIVVAIIAILAAIAVPNFLEAQVRAKISRLKADQRSVATAIESYQVDYNQPPDDMETAAAFYSSSPYLQARWHWIKVITTPVAYMTSVPEDPFTPDDAGTFTDDRERRMMKYSTILEQKLLPPISRPADGPFGEALAKGYRWGLMSYGPSRKYEGVDLLPNLGVGAGAISGQDSYWSSGAQNGDAYDATNGTISLGLIIRTNHGVYGED